MSHLRMASPYFGKSSQELQPLITLLAVDLPGETFHVNASLMNWVAPFRSAGTIGGFDA